jgi:hypothetical protein
LLLAQRKLYHSLLADALRFGASYVSWGFALNIVVSAPGRRPPGTACQSFPATQANPSESASEPAQSQSARISVPAISAGQLRATLREIELAGNDSNKLARYVFEHHG